MSWNIQQRTFRIIEKQPFINTRSHGRVVKEEDLQQSSDREFDPGLDGMQAKLVLH